ncbi:ricin-type beta-trefoil lectin domain protein [Streptomyces sp. GC420]|uniref:ricin-type beta-trefoil lectin domain protein n=1 Tax=Streptomyces sp. GC420 TaxID=2697568 RepID=UPI0014150F1F|nr:ricin-type beta-trefoil lectin domain protein [Streptomyces sp. GC420]NBM16901.1 hydrogenase expression protein [Streptomyces sp. GC420]
MSLWTSLEPASTTVDPGGSTTVRLRVRNTGDIVDEYRFEPVGDTAPWTAVEPQTLRLYPGTTGTVELTFAPPRSPDATAGPNPYGVRITPTEQPEATTVPEGNLTITPFTEVRAELVPPTVKGRFRGRPKLAVDNLGNTRLTASISGSDNGDHISYDIRPGSIQVEPGRAAFVTTTLKPRQIIWLGSKEERPYTLAVQRSGSQSVDVDGTYVQRGFLPRWLATALGVTMALAITFVMLWLAYRPQVRSLATEKLEEAAISTIPPSDPPLAVPQPSAAEETPAPGASPREEDGGSGDSGGSGGSGRSEPSTTKKPRTGGGGTESGESPAAAVGSLVIGQGSDRCIDVVEQQDGKGEDGSPLQLWDCAGGAGQKWDFRGDGTVRSLGMCMDVAWGSEEDGAQIQLARCSGNPAQQFVMSTAGDLVSAKADKCVDAKDNGTGNGTRLQLWTCAGTANQKWRIED